MDYVSCQKQFDTVKWFDSIQAGEDQCGRYAFCEKCDKEEENPCARAIHRQKDGYIRIAVIMRRA